MAAEAEASTEAGRLAGRGAVARSGARADSADLAEVHSADREAAIHSEVRAVSEDNAEALSPGRGAEDLADHGAAVHLAARADLAARGDRAERTAQSPTDNGIRSAAAVETPRTGRSAGDRARDPTAAEDSRASAAGRAAERERTPQSPMVTGIPSAMDAVAAMQWARGDSAAGRLVGTRPARSEARTDLVRRRGRLAPAE